MTTQAAGGSDSVLPVRGAKGKAALGTSVAPLSRSPLSGLWRRELAAGGTMSTP